MRTVCGNFLATAETNRKQRSLQDDIQHFGWMVVPGMGIGPSCALSGCRPGV